MAPADEGFLSRWSRLKQESREDKPVAEEDKPVAEVAPSPNPPANAEAPELKLELPSIESLTKDSDFSVFMRVGVPDALRNKALRKLWEADPSLYAHDGLTDYAEDYGKLMREGEKFAASAYKVGRGFMEEGEFPWEKEEAEAKKKLAAAKEKPPEALGSPTAANEPPPERAAEKADATPPKTERDKDGEVG